MNMTDTHVTRPRCELMTDPVGIDIAVPHLSWEIISAKRGVRQTAYRIRVADTLSETASGDTVVWDSGKVADGESIHRPYEGPPMVSRKRYYWTVRIWDEADVATPWSPVAFWEMGLLTPEDWQARWIEPRQQPAQKEPGMSFTDIQAENQVYETRVERLNPCQMLRKRFRSEGDIKRARIYATAHGVYQLELNGRRVGDIELAPEYTSYDRYLQYHTYDVTEMIRSGDNVIGAWLADGWYIGRIGLLGDSCNYGDRLALLLQLELTYADGHTRYILSDEGFTSATGPLVYSDLFIGEKYDARREHQGWSSPGFDDGPWRPVTVVDHHPGPLIAAYGEPVRSVREIEPARLITTPKGERVLDLGQNIAGRMRMRVRGPAGTSVILEHSETLDEAGNFLLNIIGRNKDQKDVYILKGTGEEVFEPRFTYHGFRYVRISNYPGNISIEHFTGVVLASDLRATGRFECSDARINQLQANIVWSQRGNMLSIPTDCPQRERAGWTGDIQVFAPTACFNMEVYTFLRRWMRNLMKDQQPDGQVPITVPYPISYQDFSRALSGTDSSAGWSDAVVIVPWVLFQRYGDIRILEETYAAMTRWLEYVAQAAQQFLWNTGFHFGDWLTPSVSIDFKTGNVDMMQSAVATKALTPSFFYAHTTGLMARIAAVLNKTEDQHYYAKLNRHIREAFAREHIDEHGRLTPDLQGMYVLALQMEMAPEALQETLIARLEELIEANDGKLDTGFLSVPFIMDVLCQFGREDVAYRLLYQTRCPSWLYEVDRGATTIWEAWQAVLPDGRVTNVSFNHYAFGCIGDWLYRHVAGLDQNQPGYRHSVIHPHPDDRLTYALAQYQSVYGEIVTHWQKKNGRLELRVKIPPNTTAGVLLPGAQMSQVTESGNAIEAADGVISTRRHENHIAVEVGSGDYIFHYPFTVVVNPE